MRILWFCLLLFVVMGCSVSYQRTSNEPTTPNATKQSGSWASMSPEEVMQQSQFEEMCEESDWDILPQPQSAHAADWESNGTFSVRRYDGASVNGVQFYYLQRRFAKQENARLVLVQLLRGEYGVLRGPKGCFGCPLQVLCINDSALAVKDFLTADIKDGWEHGRLFWSEEPMATYWYRYGENQPTFDVTHFGPVVFLMEEGSEPRYQLKWYWNLPHDPAPDGAAKAYFCRQDGYGSRTWEVAEIDLTAEDPKTAIRYMTVNLMQ